VEDPEDCSNEIDAAGQSNCDHVVWPRAVGTKIGSDRSYSTSKLTVGQYLRSVGDCRQVWMLPRHLMEPVQHIRHWLALLAEIPRTCRYHVIASDGAVTTD
jgi:hypothetical protein